MEIIAFEMVALGRTSIKFAPELDRTHRLSWQSPRTDELRHFGRPETGYRTVRRRTTVRAMIRRLIFVFQAICAVERFRFRTVCFRKLYSFTS